MGRVIYHMTWDFQGRNGTSKAGTGRLGMGRGIYHMTWDFQGRNWQVGRREEEFTASESEVEVLEPACLGGDTTGEHKGETQRGRHKGGDTKGNKTENPKTKKIEK